MACRRIAWLLAAAALFAGCGGKVVVDPPGSGGSTTTTTTTGTATQTICGGKLGGMCKPGEYCAWDPATPCGNYDGTGVCTPAPAGCTADCPGVCGCDGAFYCNACGAHQAGVDVDPNAYCGDDPPPPVDEYSAFMLPTDLPRYLIVAAKHSVDRCVVLSVSMIAGSGIGIQTTQNWSVEQAWITNSAADCAALQPGSFPKPPPSAVPASGGSGSLKQDSTDWPCWVDLDATLTFPPVAPWVPASESLVAGQLVIVGGACPI